MKRIVKNKKASKGVNLAQKKADCRKVAKVCALAGYDDVAHKIANCSNFSKRDLAKIKSGAYFPISTPMSISLCRNKFCPICQILNPYRSYSRNITIAEYVVKNNPSAIFYFVTLTIKNTATLNASIIQDLKKAFEKLIRRKIIDDMLIGYYRSIEVTYNGTKGFHPHIHAVLAFKSTFGKGTHYVSKQKFTELWQEALGDNYKSEINNYKKIPNVTGTFISKDDYGTQYETTTAQSIANQMVYMTEHVRLSDYISDDEYLNAYVFKLLYQSLKNVKLIVRSGKFKGNELTELLENKKTKRKQYRSEFENLSIYKQETLRHDGYDYKPLNSDDT